MQVRSEVCAVACAVAQNTSWVAAGATRECARATAPHALLRQASALHWRRRWRRAARMWCLPAAARRVGARRPRCAPAQAQRRPPACTRRVKQRVQRLRSRTAQSGAARAPSPSPDPGPQRPAQRGPRTLPPAPTPGPPGRRRSAGSRRCRGAAGAVWQSSGWTSATLGASARSPGASAAGAARRTTSSATQARLDGGLCSGEGAGQCGRAAPEPRVAHAACRSSRGTAPWGWGLAQRAPPSARPSATATTAGCRRRRACASGAPRPLVDRHHEPTSAAGD